MRSSRKLRRRREQSGIEEKWELLKNCLRTAQETPKSRSMKQYNLKQYNFTLLAVNSIHTR